MNSLALKVLRALGVGPACNPKPYNIVGYSPQSLLEVQGLGFKV